MKTESLKLDYEQPIVLHNFSKRVFDLAFSLGALALLLPLLLVIALAIKLSSRGPVIYKQKRVGRGGKTFACLKFRTMEVGADEKLAEVLRKNPALKAEWEVSQKLKSDPRIFPLGRFLRKTSLDELPQFWNVVCGDLSVVGPRPYMESQRVDLGHKAYTILSVRPGITGLWQTSGRSKTTYEQRIALDARYVIERSFMRDLALIAKTIPAVLATQDAC